MKRLPDDSIDLTVTSPPYDNLRTYKGYTFDFEGIAKQLLRVTKLGGVVVWVVGDATIKGSETGTSFRQALYFKEIGFNLHDTMIYKKHAPHPPNVRYWQCFEYMFVFSKGKPKTFNPLMQMKKCIEKNPNRASTYRQKDGSLKALNKNAMKRFKKAAQNNYRIADNIWEIDSGWMKSTADKIAYEHPAIFPEQLAEDHILSWSNPGDIVLDPMCGSGTTCKMAALNDRDYIGIDISEEYCELSRWRIRAALSEGVS
ncbi:MAG: site-specific DNA-methyltransferase [Clostridiales bacterium]|nr:site-specific DNA-methyltransferase [Clostridiales bacterium]